MIQGVAIMAGLGGNLDRITQEGISSDETPENTKKAVVYGRILNSLGFMFPFNIFAI